MRADKHPDERIVAFRLPCDLHEQLRDLATSQQRTLSGELRLIVERHLAEHGREAA